MEDGFTFTIAGTFWQGFLVFMAILYLIGTIQNGIIVWQQRKLERLKQEIRDNQKRLKKEVSEGFEKLKKGLGR